MLAGTQSHQHSHNQNRFAVIPTPMRLQTPVELNGHGVTIAFLDSGFFPHPDLTQPVNRISAYHDVTDPDAIFDEQQSPEGWQWHGTMTSVVGAGNGYLSNGIYRGLACHANVVLVKVSEQGKIYEENIARGFEWILRNRDVYNIKIISISLGGDDDVSYKHNRVDQLAEEAIEKGLIVVVAAGNSGCMDRHHTVPPANSPSVITVGGFNDGNQLEPANHHLYCSSYGRTADGISKPEIIAPAIWIAAPILPLTDAYLKAERLMELSEAPDYQLPGLMKKLDPAFIGLSGVFSDAKSIRAEVEAQLSENKIVSSHYQHVAGTSFAAPIVASVIAQMLQINPNLTPRTVKDILISTAERLPAAPVLRQGYGMLNGANAINRAGQENHSLIRSYVESPRIESDKLVFFYHNDSAHNVGLAGEFSGWNLREAFVKQEDGIWLAEIDVPQSGRYRYKLIINGTQWIDDPANGLKEPDEYGGFNSVVIVPN